MPISVFTPAFLNRTPVEGRVYDALPPESRTVHVRLLLPKGRPLEDVPCVLHLPGTGDFGFRRRMQIGSPLLRQVQSVYHLL
jgi:Alpha/beta hydrolase domain containing 18